MSAVDRPLLVLCGPTASGKTKTALYWHSRLPLKLISADSQLVYRKMDIGTDKPQPAIRHLFSHIDLVDPGSRYSAGRFLDTARREAETAWLSGKIPCVVGGTGLYIDALLNGLAEIPEVPSEIRLQVGKEDLNDLIREIRDKDPRLIGRLDLRNPRRIQRAVEVMRHSGVPFSTWIDGGRSGALIRGRTLIVGLDPGMEKLVPLIQTRTLSAIQDGWLDEADLLRKQYGSEAVLSTGAIGYAEMLEVLEGRTNLETAADLIARQTRQYARRQRTWFRRERSIYWADPLDASGILDKVRVFIDGKDEK